MRVFWNFLGTWLVVTILLSTMPLTASADFGGHIVRFRVKSQYMNTEDFIVEVKAFRSSSDNKVMGGEPVEIMVYIAKVVNGVAGVETLEYNTTLKSSGDFQPINLGRWELGTWKVKLICIFTDGVTRTKSEECLYSHVPIEYSLVFLEDGEKIVFHSKGGKSDTFNIEVWGNKGKTTELLCPITMSRRRL